MDVVNVSRAFQNDLINLIEKYTRGNINKSLSRKERTMLAHDYQIYLMMAAIRVLVPSGTQNAIESIIRSNVKQFEQLSRMAYKAEG